MLFALVCSSCILLEKSGKSSNLCCTVWKVVSLNAAASAAVDYDVASLDGHIRLSLACR